jgi:regulator of PEP synthase PpsR (kinase-PPPase family)
MKNSTGKTPLMLFLACKGVIVINNDNEEEEEHQNQDKKEDQKPQTLNKINEEQLESILGMKDVLKLVGRRLNDAMLELLPDEVRIKCLSSLGQVQGKGQQEMETNISSNIHKENSNVHNGNKNEQDG